jgi:hypothetical protein
MTKNTIILHIGPPKTATTSIQTAFQNNKIQGLFYAGVHQPRQKNNCLSDIIYDYAVCRSDSDNIALINAIRALDEITRDGTIAFISEEMFCVSNTKVELIKKLRLAKHALRNFNVVIVITLRNPVEAIQSYYQEIFDVLPTKYQLSFRKFCDSEIVSCFDYELLEKIVACSGFKKIKYLNIDMINNGFLSRNDLLDNNDSSICEDFSIKLPITNVSRKNIHARFFPEVTLKLNDLFSEETIKKLKSKKFFEKILGRVENFLKSVVLVRARERKLKVPHAVAHRLSLGHKAVLLRNK